MAIKEFQERFVHFVREVQSGQHGAGQLVMDGSTFTLCRAVFVNDPASNHADRYTAYSGGMNSDQLRLMYTEYVQEIAPLFNDKAHRHGLIDNNTIVRNDGFATYLDLVQSKYGTDAIFVDNFVAVEQDPARYPLLNAGTINRIRFFIEIASSDSVAEQGKYREYLSFFEGAIRQGNKMGSMGTEPYLDMLYISKVMPAWFIHEWQEPATKYIQPLRTELRTSLTYPHESNQGIFALSDGRLALIEFHEMNCLRTEASVGVVGLLSDINIHSCNMAQLVDRLMYFQRAEIQHLPDDMQSTIDDELNTVRTGINRYNYVDFLDD